MSSPRDKNGFRMRPDDVGRIDPNRAHDFIEHDHDFRCYVCGRRRRSAWHRD